MSGRCFGAHLCTESYAETNPTSSSEERRYYYDCLMAPMANQVELVVNRLEELAIRSIAPGHGPAIVDSWRSLLADYRRWGEAQRKASLVVTLLYASAYGNTAAIADAIAQGKEPDHAVGHGRPAHSDRSLDGTAGRAGFATPGGGEACQQQNPARQRRRSPASRSMSCRHQLTPVTASPSPCPLAAAQTARSMESTTRLTLPSQNTACTPPG